MCVCVCVCVCVCRVFIFLKYWGHSLRIARCQVGLLLLVPQTSAHVSIRQHTSAYVSIRQRCGLLASRLFRSCLYRIRQHTSALRFARWQVPSLCDKRTCSLCNCSAKSATAVSATVLQHLRQLQLLCTYSAAYLSQSLLRLLDILQLARFVSF